MTKQEKIAKLTALYMERADLIIRANRAASEALTDLPASPVPIGMITSAAIMAAAVEQEERLDYEIQRILAEQTSD